MGTSYVTQEFRPTETTPTREAVILQELESLKAHLDFVRAARQSLLEQQAERLRRALEFDLRAGRLDVELHSGQVVIRIREQASFSPGSAEFLADFAPMLQRIAAAITPESGHVLVAGHTDNVPIRTTQFRSNWELSAARAASVLRALLAASPQLEPARVRAAGYGEFSPSPPTTPPISGRAIGGSTSPSNRD